MEFIKYPACTSLQPYEYQFKKFSRKNLHTSQKHFVVLEEYKEITNPNLVKSTADISNSGIDKACIAPRFIQVGKLSKIMTWCLLSQFYVTHGKININIRLYMRTRWKQAANGDTRLNLNSSCHYIGVKPTTPAHTWHKGRQIRIQVFNENFTEMNCML